MKLKGFTLIELLIVVLIIAILAAIAVPNFLEFQTRAKVARVKADMRTIATAIEAYAVDYGEYPLDQNEMAGFGYTGTNREAVREAYNRLSSPISYISSAPNDPYLLYEDLRDTYLAYRFWTHRGDGNHAGNEYSTFSHQLYESNFHWHVQSIGPSVTFNIPPGNPGAGGNVDFAQVVANPFYPLYIYDPTNGTVSFGFIHRSNKGEFIGSHAGVKP